MFLRKYPQASSKKIMKEYLERMKKQFYDIFDSLDTMSTGSQPAI